MPVDLQRAESLFKKLDELLSKTRSRPLPERVHHIRTNTRRVEALLETLYRDSHPPRKLMKLLGRLRRRAGKVRDMDVQMTALRSLKIGREAERKAQLMQYLIDQRFKRQEKLIAELEGDHARKLRKRLEKTREALFPAAAGDHAQRDAVARKDAAAASLAANLDPTAIALRNFSTVSRRYRELDPANLHGLRTECKRIRYTAEVAKADDDTKQMLTLLKQLQDAIGDWHDWQVLTEEAVQLFAGSTTDSALISALRNVAQAKFSAARSRAIENRRELLKLYRDRNRRMRLASAKKGSQPATRDLVASTRVAATGSGAA